MIFPHFSGNMWSCMPLISIIDHSPNICQNLCLMKAGTIMCEFGAPVWILLQGQKVDQKMQLKSKQQIYVSFDDGAGAIKYYNAETWWCNILTFRNFKQITPPQTTPIPKNMDITPDSWHEGESDGDVLPIGVTGSDDITLTLKPGSRKCKRNLLERDIYINAPWKTCGICMDYKSLHNPYPEE